MTHADNELNYSTLSGQSVSLMFKTMFTRMTVVLTNDAAGRNYLFVSVLEMSGLDSSSLCPPDDTSLHLFITLSSADTGMWCLISHGRHLF